MVIEKACDSQLRREANFSSVQCGFKPKTGTENALLRYIYGTHRGHNCIASLDINGAFPSGRRDKLMGVVDSSISVNTAATISHFLKPMEISTVGDKCFALYESCFTTPLILQGAALKKEPKTEYLGTTITNAGIDQQTLTN